ncbi:hypothetical protein ACWEQL_42065, partial [Kitasatospora sp. NPDC004240]
QPQRFLRRRRQVSRVPHRFSHAVFNDPEPLPLRINNFAALDDHLLPIKAQTSTSTPVATHASPVTCSFKLKRAH